MESIQREVFYPSLFCGIFCGLGIAIDIFVGLLSCTKFKLPYFHRNLSAACPCTLSNVPIVLAALLVQNKPRGGGGPRESKFVTLRESLNEALKALKEGNAEGKVEALTHQGMDPRENPEAAQLITPAPASTLAEGVLGGSLALGPAAVAV